MPKSPRSVSGWEVIRALERLGFRQVRQHGSHVILKKQTPAGEIGCVVLLHGDLAAGTLRSVLRQAQVDLDTFLENL